MSGAEIADNMTRYKLTGDNKSLLRRVKKEMTKNRSGLRSRSLDRKVRSNLVVGHSESSRAVIPMWYQWVPDCT